jgi:hypothetical protein
MDICDDGGRRGAFRYTYRNTGNSEVSALLVPLRFLGLFRALSESGTFPAFRLGWK